jgi:hypothetical protein
MMSRTSIGRRLIAAVSPTTAVFIDPDLAGDSRKERP